jgi:WG containing repeat
MQNLKLLLSGLLVLMLFSCSSNTDHLSIDLIPFQTKKDGKISLMKLNGEIVLSDEFNDGSKIFSSEGIILETKSDKVNYYRINDKKLTQITLEKNYEAGTPFFNGFALVRDEDGRLSFIEKSGKEAISLASISGINIVRAGIVSDGLIKVKSSEGYWGFIDTKGEIVIKPEYVMVENFVNGKARVKTDQGKVLVIDKNNKALFTGKEDFYYFPVNGNDEMVFFDKASKDKYAGLLTLKGEVVIKDAKYKYIRHMNGSDFLVVTNEDGLWGVVNKKREYVGELRAKFNQAPIILKDGFAVADDKKIKFYDKSGKLSRQVEGYGNAISIDGEHLIAETNKKKSVQILNSKGEELLQDNIYPSSDTWMNLFYKSRFINQLADFENQLSLESTYFDFETNFKAIFANTTQTGIWGITNASNVLVVEKAFNDLKARSSVKKATVKADRSLNYSYLFYAEKDPDTLTQVGEDAATAALEGSTPAVDPSSSAAADSTATVVLPDVPKNVEPQVKDPYPFIGLYEREHKLASVHIGDITISATAYFSDYVKTETYGLIQDPIFKETHTGLTGYELNPIAQLKSINISYSLDDYDMNKKFAEKMISELGKMGWKEESAGNLVNTKTGNRISVSYGQVNFYFN